MALTPQYAAVPRVGAALVSTANANRDGTGTITTVFTAGANGSRVEKAFIKATTATVEGQVRLFLHDGTNYFLLTEFFVDVDDAATTSVENGCSLEFAIPTGYSIRASTTGNPFNVIVTGGDF